MRRTAMYRKACPLQLVALALAAFANLILTSSAPSYADDIVGWVINASGIAQIKRAGTAIAAAPGVQVRLHDAVTTQEDSSVTLGFPDGSTVTLGEYTTILIQEGQIVAGKKMPSKVTLLAGNLHTNLPDKSAAGPHTMEVDTPHAKTVGTAGTQ